nr:hypothetical protein Iba_chr03aCG15430 [Ipomoea batatas]GMC72727.1 hypothetical protein Iba_chr03bCG14230 [Ipomoea batatas]GME02531.1 hypothetical protein Iba_scaffold137CG0140 [Ipomoea batatas]
MEKPVELMCYVCICDVWDIMQYANSSSVKPKISGSKLSIHQSCEDHD